MSGQRDGYRAVFAAIRAQQWTNAQIGLDSMKPGPLHAIARAELYTAKGSPKATADPADHARQRSPRTARGGERWSGLPRRAARPTLPPLPTAQALIWQDGAPRRVRAKAIKSDQIAADLAAKMQPLVKADLGPGRRRRCSNRPAGLSADATDRMAAARRLDVLSCRATTPTPAPRR